MTYDVTKIYLRISSEVLWNPDKPSTHIAQHIYSRLTLAAVEEYRGIAMIARGLSMQEVGSIWLYVSTSKSIKNQESRVEVQSPLSVLDLSVCFKHASVMVVDTPTYR